MTDEHAVHERIREMRALLNEARPMMEDKCCHFEWCVERRGIASDNPAEGFREVIDGMHPGCAPYRHWLDRYQVVVGTS